MRLCGGCSNPFFMYVSKALCDGLYEENPSSGADQLFNARIT